MNPLFFLLSLAQPMAGLALNTQSALAPEARPPMPRLLSTDLRAPMDAERPRQAPEKKGHAHGPGMKKGGERGPGMKKGGKRGPLGAQSFAGGPKAHQACKADIREDRADRREDRADRAEDRYDQTHGCSRR